MAAILPRPTKRSKRVSNAPTNYQVIDKGRRYRVCATSYGRVLMVMLRHVHSEQALDTNKRRARWLIRAAAEQYGVELSCAAR